MHFDYTPTGVCSRHIEFDIDSEGRLHNVRFTGGCHGNTQGIGALTEGMDAREAAKRMGGMAAEERYGLTRYNMVYGADGRYALLTH